MLSTFVQPASLAVVVAARAGTAARRQGAMSKLSKSPHTSSHIITLSICETLGAKVTHSNPSSQRAIPSTLPVPIFHRSSRSSRALYKQQQTLLILFCCCSPHTSCCTHSIRAPARLLLEYISNKNSSLLAQLQLSQLSVSWRRQLGPQQKAQAGEGKCAHSACCVYCSSLRPPACCH